MSNLKHIEFTGEVIGTIVYDPVNKDLKIIPDQQDSSPPTTEQTELWKEAFAVAYIGNLHDAEISELSRKYVLTRKEELPEAVEFGKFISERLVLYNKDRDVWFELGDLSKTYSNEAIYAEFQLFKNHPGK